MRAALAVALVLLGAVPPAPPTISAPQTFQFQRNEAWNRHSTFGADGERLSTRVDLALEADGTVRVADTGERKESNLSNTWGYRETVTTWANTWTGTWAESGGQLVLKLTPDQRQCEIVEGGLEGEVEPEHKPCPPIPKKIRFDCDLRQLDVGPAPPELTITTEPQQAWFCLPAGDSAATGGTSSAWVFGTDVCLSASNGLGSMVGGSYRLCGE